MKIVPSSLLSNLYAKGSLKRIQNGFSFVVSNRTPGIMLTKVLPAQIDGETWPVAGVSFLTADSVRKAAAISPRNPWKVPQGDITVRVQGKMLGDGEHTIKIPVEAKLLGRLDIAFRDSFQPGG